MANWSNPLLTSNYVNFVDEVKGRDDDAARQFDPANTSATNVPVNTIRWNGSANRWERWNGTAWNVLSSGYAISITGNAATASAWQTGRTLTIGNTGKSVNGGANVSWTLAEIGAVGLTGNETVAGQKTFSSPPVLNFTPPGDSYAGWGNGFSIADTAAPFGGATVTVSFVFNSNRGIQFATNSSADNQPLAFRRVHTSFASGLGEWTNLVDVASTQTIGGTKTFSNPIVGSITGTAGSTSAITGSGATLNFGAAARADLTSASGQTTTGLRMLSNNGGTAQGWLYGDGTAFGLLGSDSNWSLRINNSNRQFEAPIVGGTNLFPAFMCRAWVNFNGTTSPGTIRASGNVSSVTRNGTGDYTVNFTTAMPDANYSINVNNSPVYGSALAASPSLNTNGATVTESAPTTSSFRFYCARLNTAAFDPTYINASIFR